MGRWEPDAAERLQRAAIGLFVELGYDAVTISQIAERAGLTRRSFFRYFPDKREVLFLGSERLAPEIERRLRAASADEPVPDVVIRVLGEVGGLLLIDRHAQQRRRVVIAASPELRERDRSKSADTAASIARALIGRGTPSVEANLLGAVYSEAFRSAYDQALEDDELSLEDHLSAAIRMIETSLRPH